MNKTPSLFVSILPILTIAIFLTVGYGILGIRAEILLVGAAVVAGTIASFLGIPYRDILDGIVKSISKALPAMLIVITVGALIGSWIAAGTIPMLIYFGLDVISPRFFLVTACIVASIVSVVTGTSYGTVGTIGVAFMGIAHGLGISVGQAAGAIVAGAYFGDKISPFSDTTNLAPIAAGSNLYDHIRHMFWTTLPAWVIGLIVYFVTGLASRGGDVSIPETVQIQTVLQETFRFHVILLVPPAITLTAALLKKPVIPGMLLSVLSAVILAISIQGSEIKSAMNSTVTGYTADTSYEMVDTLLTRGGMLSMMDVTLIALCAFAFGGIVQRAGMLDIILERLLRFARTTGRLVASTVLIMHSRSDADRKFVSVHPHTRRALCPRLSSSESCSKESIPNNGRQRNRSRAPHTLEHRSGIHVGHPGCRHDYIRPVGCILLHPAFYSHYSTVSRASG